MLKDIIDADYKSLNTEQLAELIEQNKATIRKLLKQYFAIMQREEQRKKEQRLLVEQTMKRPSTKAQKKNLPKTDDFAIEDPINHVDMIIEEYINLKQINQELGKTMAAQTLGENRKKYTSDTEAAIASTKLFAQKMGEGLPTEDAGLQPQESEDAQQGGGEYHHNMKRMQNKEFKKLKANVLSGITDQVKAFTEKFNAQISLAEEKINRLIIQKLNNIEDRFDTLPDEDKEFFLLKIQEKAIRDRQKMLSAKQNLVWDLPGQNQKF